MKENKLPKFEEWLEPIFIGRRIRTICGATGTIDGVYCEGIFSIIMDGQRSPTGRWMAPYFAIELIPSTTEEGHNA